MGIPVLSRSKPGQNTPIDYGHSLAANLHTFIPMWEGAGSPIDYGSKGPRVTTLIGSGIPTWGIGPMGWERTYNATNADGLTDSQIVPRGNVPRTVAIGFRPANVGSPAGGAGTGLFQISNSQINSSNQIEIYTRFVANRITWETNNDNPSASTTLPATSATSTTPINSGDVLFAVMVYDGVKWTGFLNGKLDFTSVSTINNGFDQVLTLGGGFGNPTGPNYAGSIWYFASWDRAFVQSDVSWLSTDPFAFVPEKRKRVFVVRVPVFIQPSPFVSTVAFGQPTIHPVQVQPSPIVSTVTTGTPNLRIEVRPDSFVSTVEFGKPGTSIVQKVSPDPIVSTVAFGTPGFKYEVHPDPFVSTVKFNPPVTTHGPTRIQPDPFVSRVKFGSQ